MRNQTLKVRLNDAERGQDCYKKLLEDIINKKCILVVGSGISKKSFGKNRKTLPNWYEFLDCFIDWEYKNAKYSKKDHSELKRLLKDSNKFPIIAGDLLERTSKNELKEFLEDVFSPQDIHPSYLHKLISLIPFRAIITTNYDNLIEKAYYEINNRFPKILASDNINIDSNVPEQFFVAKIHGDIEDPSTIVLSQIDYMNLLHQSPNYLDFMQKLFKNYTILFIGYSFSDPDIRFIVDKLSFEENYCFLVLDNQNITQIECERYFKDKKIVVLGYDNFDKSYRRLDEGFKDICDFVVIKDYSLFQKISAAVYERHFSIMVLFGKVDKEDGFFIRDYFYRNKTFIVRAGNDDFKYSTIFERFNEIAPNIDFVLIYIGKSKLSNNNSNFYKAIKLVKQYKNRSNYRILVAATSHQNEKIEEMFSDHYTHYIKDNFSDIDISPIFQYASNLAFHSSNSSSFIIDKCVVCPYFSCKYDSMDIISKNLYSEYEEQIKEYTKYISEKKLENAIEIIDKLLSLSESKFERVFFRELIYEKIKCLFWQKLYIECLGVFEQYKIHQINNETFDILEYKVLCHSYLSNYEIALTIVNKLLEDCRDMFELQYMIFLKLKVLETAKKCLEHASLIKKYIADMPKEFNIISQLEKRLKKCFSCKHYSKQLEKTEEGS